MFYTAPKWYEWRPYLRLVMQYLNDHDAYTKADMLALIDAPWQYEAEAVQVGIDTSMDPS